jgi:hypothetical protein
LEKRNLSSRVYEIDPLKDPRWQDLLQRHPAASVFHSSGWLEALRRTYGYESVAFTTSPPTEKLANGLLFSRVRSWITGRRIVSIPFSDHCAPLCESEEHLESLLSELQNKRREEKWRYIELRPLGRFFPVAARKLGFKPTANYLLHRVDLEPSEEEIFARLHKNCVQRRIRHAGRAGVLEVCGNFPSLLKDFFGLMVRTRIRHRVPPPPFIWFQNVLDCLKDAADLRLAYLNGIPIAAVLILHFQGTSYFKYGCSDERFHSYGAIPLLLWRAILKAKSVGSNVLDLGRTDCDDHGLTVFKDHWTPGSDPLTYWAFPSDRAFSLARASSSRWAKNVLNLSPDPLLSMAGTVFYRHIG